MKNTVIGIGSLHRADDGVGVQVIHRLKDERPDLEAVELSTSSLEILDFIRNRDKVVIVDAIKTGVKPGTIHKIMPQKLKSIAFSSSHYLNIAIVLQLGHELYEEEMPKKLVILAVEAEDIDSYSNKLTTKVHSAITELLEYIRNELDEKEVK